MEKRYYPALEETVFQETLPNGLTVLVVPRPGFTRKLAYFITDFGAIHRNFTLNGKTWETPAGIAHFLEHKLFDMPDMDVMAEFAALGANPNAFTSYDVTAYHIIITMTVLLAPFEIQNDPACKLRSVCVQNPG